MYIERNARVFVYMWKTAVRRHYLVIVDPAHRSAEVTRRVPLPMVDRQLG